MDITDIYEKEKQTYDSFLKSRFVLHKVKTDIRERNDKKKKEYSWQWMRTKSVEKILKEYLEDREHRVFYKLFGINPKTICYEMSFANVPLEKDTYSPHNYEMLYDQGLSILSSIDFSEMHIDKEEVNLAELCNFDYEIVAKNEFQGSILVKYSFDYVEEINPWAIIEYSERYLECTAYAVYEYEQIPLWQEYILSSFVFYHLGNKRMAFFNAFAAIDQCIEIMYELLFTVYLSMVKYTLCSDVSAEAKEYILKRYDLYQKKERRLIDEKLKDCLKAISLEKDYSQFIEKLNEFEKIRNKIAHCENVEDLESSEDYINLMWLVLELLSKTNGKNVEDFFEFTN